MQAIQLSLFEEPKKIESIYNEYFLKHFNWIPEVGKEARIDVTIAIENLSKPTHLYCASAEIIVKQIINDEAICETTDKWVEDCKNAGEKNNTKDIFRVKLRDLGKTFK